MQPGEIQIIIFLLVYFALFTAAAWLLRNRKVLGKSIKEYIWPVRFFVPLAVFGAVWQYLGPPPEPAMVGQTIWLLAAFLSALTLARKRDFSIKHAAALAIIYSLLIHGAKCSLRYFIYGNYDPVYRTLGYLSGRFLYGSVLVGFTVVFTALAVHLYRESKNKNIRRLALLILGMVLSLTALLISIKLYRPDWGFSPPPWLLPFALIVLVIGVVGGFVERRFKK